MSAGAAGQKRIICDPGNTKKNDFRLGNCIFKHRPWKIENLTSTICGLTWEMSQKMFVPLFVSNRNKCPKSTLKTLRFGLWVLGFGLRIWFAGLVLRVWFSHDLTPRQLRVWFADVVSGFGTSRKPNLWTHLTHFRFVGLFLWKICLNHRFDSSGNYFVWHQLTNLSQ